MVSEQLLLQLFAEAGTGTVPRMSEGDPNPMLFLVAALLLLGVVMGTVAHAPVTFTLVAATVIAAWLGAFALRERHGRRHHTRTHNH